jgi:hypothetical protein
MVIAVMLGILTPFAMGGPAHATIELDTGGTVKSNDDHREIRPLRGDKCLDEDISGFYAVSSGGGVRQWDCLNGTNQQWPCFGTANQLWWS